jgi:hypothetical protein
MNVIINNKKVKMVLNGKTVCCYLKVNTKTPELENVFLTSNGYKFMTTDNKVFLVKEA